jgi:hypothetical protein
MTIVSRVCPNTAHRPDLVDDTEQQFKGVEAVARLTKRLIRIKSPQLYRLSYRPKLLQRGWNLLRSLLRPTSCVPAVYPIGVASDVSMVPPAPISDDDVMAPYRRWGCP